MIQSNYSIPLRIGAIFQFHSNGNLKFQESPLNEQSEPKHVHRESKACAQGFSMAFFHAQEQCQTTESLSIRATTHANQHDTDRERKACKVKIYEFWKEQNQTTTKIFSPQTLTSSLPIFLHHEVWEQPLSTAVDLMLRRSFPRFTCPRTSMQVNAPRWI